MGGGVIRSAVKALPSRAFRSKLIDEAGRQQVSSFVPAVESQLVVPTLSAGQGCTEDPAVAGAAHWPVLEYDEWELTGGREERFESVNDAPRLIFGPAPSLEEAREATADLKDALQQAYFTPQPTLESPELCQATNLGECTISAAPKHITQMFSLLHRSSEAQGIVASLASDENVWNAVMKNEKVVQLFQNTSPAISQACKEPAESVAENKVQDVFSPTCGRNSVLHKIKAKASRMANKVSQMADGIVDFVNGYLGVESGSSSSGKASTSSTFDKKYMIFGNCLALAVMAIFVIILKRI